VFVRRTFVPLHRAARVTARAVSLGASDPIGNVRDIRNVHVPAVTGRVGGNGMKKGRPLATHSITQVHVERSYGSTHDHIARLKVLNQTGDYGRDQIIRAIRGGDVFYTHATPPAKVHVSRCPHCSAGDYLTTSPDGTKRNNLLDLPRY
jgi:hypothetical protein